MEWRVGREEEGRGRGEEVEKIREGENMLTQRETMEHRKYPCNTHSDYFNCKRLFPIVAHPLKATRNALPP